MLAALHPEHVQIEQMKLSVDTKSDLSFGAVLADLRAKPSVGRDTAVCVHVAAPGKWLQTILEKVGNESR
jgi:purine nucleosidase